MLRRSRATRRARIHTAEIRGAVAGVEVADIHRVEQIETFRHKLKPQFVPYRKCALQADIDRLQRIAFKSISGLAPHPVIVSEHVTINVKTSVFAEVLRRL